MLRSNIVNGRLLCDADNVNNHDPEVKHGVSVLLESEYC